MSRTPTDEEVQREWEEFWAPIVEKEGELDVEQVKKERYDWSKAMDEVGKVYCAITGNRLSKPTYPAEVVLGAYEEELEKERGLCRECGEEEVEGS